MNNLVLDFQQQPITREELAKVYASKKVKELNEQYNLLYKKIIEKKINLEISFTQQFDNFIKDYKKVSLLKEMLESNVVLEYKFTRVMSEKEESLLLNNPFCEFSSFNIYDFDSHKEGIIENSFPKLKVSVLLTSGNHSIKLFNIEEIFCFDFEDNTHLLKDELKNIEIELKKDWKEEYNTLLILNTLSKVKIDSLNVIKLPEFTEIV